MERKKLIFIVTITHIFTYILCGLIFLNIFNYTPSFEQSALFRNMDELIVGLAPLFQILRGLLYSLIFILLEKSMFISKNSWFKIWLVLIILGIFNVPITADGSIEGFIYLNPTNEPLNIKIGGLIEVLTQTLLFSVIINFSYWKILKKSK